MLYALRLLTLEADHCLTTFVVDCKLMTFRNLRSNIMTDELLAFAFVDMDNDSVIHIT